MEPHRTESAERRRRMTRLLGWIFVGLGALQLFLGDWLYGLFLLAYALFLLMSRAVERLPRAARYLIVAAFAAFAVFMFVRMVIDFSSAR